MEAKPTMIFKSETTADITLSDIELAHVMLKHHGNRCNSETALTHTTIDSSRNIIASKVKASFNQRQIF